MREREREGRSFEREREGRSFEREREGRSFERERERERNKKVVGDGTKANNKKIINHQQPFCFFLSLSLSLSAKIQQSCV